VGDPNGFTIASALGAPAARVWARVITREGINHELAPWMRMTMPSTFTTLDPREVPLGRRLFRSWILLGGVLPIDYDDLTLVSIDPGRGFHERSAMASARVWEHRRTLRDEGPARCVLTDEIRFEPRCGLVAPVLRAISTRLFAHRHRRLRAHFAGAPA
jgi:ligand-binding SRPBCC domain-containing protein